LKRVAFCSLLQSYKGVTGYLLSAVMASSAGCVMACYTENIRIKEGDALRSVIERADKALYMAKDAGRNCDRKMI